MWGAKMRTLALFLAGVFTFAFSSAQAATIYATQVIDFYDSGAGPLAGPYGGDTTGPKSVPPSYAADGYAGTFVSLPTGSYMTLGFVTGYIINGPGNDIYIEEPGDGLEVADVYISSNFGLTFVFLGKAYGNTLTALDLDTIGYTGHVNAVKIVGLDAGGASPGFDLAFVSGFEGSSVATPLPATLPMFVPGMGTLGLLRWRRKRKHAGAITIA
jgi:hypothetical protein